MAGSTSKIFESAILQYMDRSKLSTICTHFTLYWLPKMEPTRHKILNSYVHILPTMIHELSNHFVISLQLYPLEGAQPRMGHTVTSFSLQPGRAQVNMFGGCLKWDERKSLSSQSKLTETTVLEFGELHLQLKRMFLQQCVETTFPIWFIPGGSLLWCCQQKCHHLSNRNRKVHYSLWGAM